MQSLTYMPPKFGSIIFIDRSLASKRPPALLERMGFEIELHNNHFVHDEDDDKWIPGVAARQWVILSGDKRISVEPLNKEAVRESKAQVLLVTDSNSLPEQWAASIIVGRTRIQELLEKNPGPVFIKIGKQAKEHVHIAKEHIFDKPEPPKPATSSTGQDAVIMPNGQPEKAPETAVPTMAVDQISGSTEPSATPAKAGQVPSVKSPPSGGIAQETGGAMASPKAIS